MKRITSAWPIFLAALVIIAWGAVVTGAQTTGPTDEEKLDMARTLGTNPGFCSGLQDRINSVVAIYGSSVSDSEKIAGLTKAINQSLEEMLKAASQDSEIGNAIKPQIALIQELMTAAPLSTSGNNKEVSAAVKDDLKKMKVMTKDYVNMMKLMCPKLTLPELMKK